MEHLISRFLPTNREAKIRVVDLKGISRIGSSSSRINNNSSSSDVGCSSGCGSSSSSNSSSGGISTSFKESSKATKDKRYEYLAENTSCSGLADFAYNDHCSCSRHHEAVECM